MVIFCLLLLLIAADVAAQPETARLIVEPSALDLAVDSTFQLKATAYDTSGNVQSSPRLIWWTSDSLVVSVDKSGSLTAKNPGLCTVYVLAPDRRRASVDVRVPDLPATEIAYSALSGPLYVRTSMPLEVNVRNRRSEQVPGSAVTFASSNDRVALVDEGRVYGIEAGNVTITASSGDATITWPVEVVKNPIVSYEIETERMAEETGDVARLRLIGTTAGGMRIETLHPEWQLDRTGASIEADNTEGVFVAEVPGRYTVTAHLGPASSHSMTLDIQSRTSSARLTLIGRGAIANHHTGDMWVFEGIDGRDYVYTGTYVYDWMKVWDVTDPQNPMLTDSLQFDARRINDIKIHPNNRLGIATREGASSRRNGIVLLDLSTPAHPTILSEYTATVTGGVHNVWIDGENQLVYAVHNGTSDVHIIDIADPEQPNEVGRWGLDRSFKTLHDIIIQDGYAYVSYWDDGIVMLDVGAGTHGGTPTEPVLVSRYAYPIGNTHVAWRSGRYVFVGDEIFPDNWNQDGGDPIEARGYIHVIDYIDPEHPVEVAKYEVPEAGAHNIWVEGDRLYVGYYQGGLRVVDISGELRGDLYKQGREIATLRTVDGSSYVPGWPMTWGAQVFKGRIYSSDMNSGLWITELEEPAPTP